ncbi:hypothetical protein niasHT_003882 [Heterodera trifolii]|uniref:Uncharacterized protein n=1 Tax=Heterodera trifolii TaxID=157864 RepID=A0ABD2LV81_9BILA
MSALQSLLDKLSDHQQNKKAAPSPSPPQRNVSPNSFTKTEIEMAKTLCTLPTNGRDERTDNGTEEAETNVKEEESKSEGMEVVKLGEGDDGICRPIGRPFSALSSSGEKIFLNANFESFAEFDCAFEEWKSLYKHPFRVASSEKHHDAKFKYRYVVYHCSRYGEPRKRGQGRRPHQNYLPCGCLAKLRLNFHPQPGDGCLCVTTLHTEHNHEPMSECHSIWLKRRKSSPEEDAAGAAERSGEGGRDFESSTMSGEHSPISTASSSTALFSPLSLHAPQPHQQLLHNSPSSSGGQSSSESAGSSSSGGETAAVAALLMRSMPRSPLSEATGGGKTQRQTTTAEKGPSAMFVDSADLGNNPPPSLSLPFKHSLFAAASHPHQFTPNQQNHSLLLTTLKAALMANANGGSGSKDGAQIGGGIGNAKKLAGELLFRQQQQQRTADQRQMDQRQMQQQHWHIMPIIQELLRLEQQQNSQTNGNGINHPQNGSPNHQTLFALISQSLQREHNAKRAASPPPSAAASSLGSSTTALLSALRSINAPAPPPVPIPSSVGFFSSNHQPAPSPSSPSSSSTLFHPPTVSPLIGLLQQAHLISSIGQPYGANGGQCLSPPQTQQTLNGTTAYIAQQMQIGGEQQRREQQQQMAAENAMIGRAEIIKEADLLLQTLVNQMIHSKDLVSYLARLRHFLTGTSP